MTTQGQYQGQDITVDKTLSHAEQVAQAAEQMKAIDQTAAPAPTSTSSTSVRKQLASAQVPSGAVDSITDQEAFDAFAKKLTPTTPAPDAPDFKKTYEAMRQAEGVADLETEILANRDQQQEILDELKDFELGGAGGAITTGIFRGRMSEEQRAAQLALDGLRRDERMAIDQLALKNDFIKMMLDFTEKDYNIARGEYEFEFNKNLQLQTAFSTEQNRILDNARASLNTIYNMAKDAGIKYDDWDPVMKANINSMELQAGLPMGLFETFANNEPTAEILSTTSRTTPGGIKVIDMVMRDPATGEITAKTIQLGAERITGGTGPSPTIKLSSAQRTTLLGAGFSSEDIVDLEKGVSQFGIQATLQAIDDPAQRQAVADAYGAQEILDQIETAELGPDAGGGESGWWKWWSDQIEIPDVFPGISILGLDN